MDPRRYSTPPYIQFQTNLSSDSTVLALPSGVIREAAFGCDKPSGEEEPQPADAPQNAFGLHRALALLAAPKHGVILQAAAAAHED